VQVANIASSGLQICDFIATNLLHGLSFTALYPSPLRDGIFSRITKTESSLRCSTKFTHLSSVTFLGFLAFAFFVAFPSSSIYSFSSRLWKK